MPEHLGLEKGKVKLEDYSPSWEALYHSEEILIHEALKDDIVCVAHIGSTAIPNLRAKPIIDILLVLKNNAVPEAAENLLDKLGYRQGEFPKEEGAFFIKGRGEVHTHYLHLRQEMHGWKKYIQFRDYLRANPEVAVEYQLLKDHLREQFHSKREFYTKGKEEFILNILSKIQ